jgi:hypothetical protein
MKSLHSSFLGGLLGAGVLLTPLPVAAATVPLPATAALPLGSSTTPGFTVRVVQAPADAVVANNAIRAAKQINGTLTDAAGSLIPNEALPGPGSGGAYTISTVNFERDGLDITITALDGTELAYLSSQPFPGIPGSGGHTEKFAVEAVAFLELTAGEHTFGVSTTAERTDINDDDAYQVFVARNPRDYFGLKVAEFERIAPGFQNNWRNENQFTVNAPVAGLYPFRILYWQTGSGANLHFYSISTAGDRIPVNETIVPGAIKAFADTGVAEAKGPYVAEVAPAPGSEGNNAAAPIEALIVDGTTTVAASGVRLFLNETPVTPQLLTKLNDRITLRYDPNASRTNPDNAVRLEYTDSGSITYTSLWSFRIIVAGGSATQVTGQWDFNNGDLRATVGQPLEYFDGPAGLTAAGTRFGTTATLGVPAINGEVAAVMEVPGDVRREIGYLMTHGIAPNGGGTRVNQYTLIMDVLVDTTGPGAASLLQISSLNNTDDGDLFWQGNNFGQGNGGYNGRGTFTPGEWHRIVAAYDMAANPPVVTKYVDGIKQDDWTANQGLDNPRRALQPTAILFADGDQDERRKMWVNSIQIRAGKLSDAEAAWLGGPSAAGVPRTLPLLQVAGQWDFDFGDLGPTVGKGLEYLDGPEGLTKAGTLFGTTAELGVADIGGQTAKVMRVPGDLDRNIGYVMTHGIAPNGGGTRVNQYTLIMDVLVATTGPGAASLLQISSLNNTDDGDLFWQGNNFGQGNGGYNGRGTFTPGEWHRIVAAYDMAANPPVVTKYVDGIKQDDWTANQGLDNPRRALQPTAFLFADGDQDERREMWVNSIQIRPNKISDAEAAWLGGPSVAGIPLALPRTTVTGQWDFEFGDLGASVGSPLAYLDGPEGLTKAGTQFGTTTELGVPDIGGQPARIMRVPGDLVRNIGYVMEHRIKPNGGGTRVNQYTLILDVLVAETGPGAASLLQISSLSNTDDGDLFWQGNNFGQGNGGYNGTGAFTAGAWHRVVAAYDMAANPPVVVKYVDGIFQDNWTANQGLDNPRRALQPTAILFADGDQDERREMWVNAIQIREGRLSNAEIEALNGPSAAGIPVVIEGVPPVVEPPVLRIAKNPNGSITLSWESTATFVLETKERLTDPAWTTVPGVTGSPVTLTPGTATAFYRLRQ